MRPGAFVAALAMPLLTSAVLAAESGVAAKGREILDRYQSALVSVKLVETSRWIMSGRQGSRRDRKREVSGVVIDPSGLTVVSHYSIDPSAPQDDASSTRFRRETNLSDVKIVLDDNTEIPADVILIDRDWDLAFVCPKAKLEKSLPHIALVKATDPQLLDDIILPGRLGRGMNRTPELTTAMISTVLKKPRTFYLATRTQIGCPVFNVKGEALGLALYRRCPRDSEGYSRVLPVIVPSEDIMEVAEQALAVKRERMAKSEQANGN